MGCIKDSEGDVKRDIGCEDDVGRSSHFYGGGEEPRRAHLSFFVGGPYVKRLPSTYLPLVISPGASLFLVWSSPHGTVDVLSVVHVRRTRYRLIVGLVSFTMFILYKTGMQRRTVLWLCCTALGMSEDRARFTVFMDLNQRRNKIIFFQL